MMSILRIPQGVDFSQPQQVATASSFKDAIEDWKDIDDKTYHKWQEFILTYSTSTEIESDNWLDKVLYLSMEKTLRAEVESDITRIPLHQRGSLTTLRCIIKRMVIKNQEAKDALGNYIRSFDITKFPGENVPTACLRLKAVATSLGENDLPSNIIRKTLEGFGKSSTTEFNDFCSSQIALRRSSFYTDLMRGSSLLVQLNNLLEDLEVTYLALVGGDKWSGIIATPSTSAFVNEVHDDQEVEDDARALAAKSNIPWEEWVKKYAKCHYCGKLGHIRPDCPEYLKKVASGELTRFSSNRPRHNNWGRSPREPKYERPRNQVDKKKFLKNPKAKAFLSAFQALFCDESDSEDDDPAPKEEEGDDDGVDSELHSFLSMVGSSLKE